MQEVHALTPVILLLLAEVLAISLMRPLGLSPIVGYLAAGPLDRPPCTEPETPYRYVIQTEARPFRDLLVGYFFIRVGMSLDWHALLMYWEQILLVLMALIAVKALLVSVAAWSFGWSVPGSVQLGFLLAQGSAFSLSSWPCRW